MNAGVATQGPGQTLRAMRTAAAFAACERDYLVGGLQGLGTQQMANAIAEILSLFLEGLDSIETQIHLQLRLPLQAGKRSLQLAYYAALTGDLAAIANSIEITCTNFSCAHGQYEEYAFLRILCSCTASILWGLQGDCDRMSYHIREALSELEAFRFLKISAAVARITATSGAEEFVPADLECHAALKIDALPIPEWGVTLAALRTTLQSVREV